MYLYLGMFRYGPACSCGPRSGRKVLRRLDEAAGAAEDHQAEIFVLASWSSVWPLTWGLLHLTSLLSTIVGEADWPGDWVIGLKF